MQEIKLVCQRLQKISKFSNRKKISFEEVLGLLEEHVPSKYPERELDTLEKLLKNINMSELSEACRAVKKKVAKYLESGLTLKAFRAHLMKFAVLKYPEKEEPEAYKAYCENMTDNELENISKRLGEIETKTPTENTKNDIIVPQGYYHVTQKSEEISGLMTNGASPCTALAMSGVSGEKVAYALTHIDDETDIKKVIQGMIAGIRKKLNEPNENISLSAYLSSASGISDKTTTLQDTPKKVVPVLKELNIDIKSMSTSTDIRIGGNDDSLSKDDSVFASDKLSGLQHKKEVIGLIQQVNAMPKMVRGHDNWEALGYEEDKSNETKEERLKRMDKKSLEELNKLFKTGRTDPIEDVIYHVIKRIDKIETPNQTDETNTKNIKPEEDSKKLKPSKELIKLKTTVKNHEKYYNNYGMGKKLLEWANNE